MGLTKRQAEIYTFVATAIRANGYSPSLAEIGAAMRLSSLSTVHQHITNLIDKGYLRRAWNRSRSIEIAVRADGRCPTCGRLIYQEDHMTEPNETNEVDQTADAPPPTEPPPTPEPPAPDADHEG